MHNTTYTHDVHRQVGIFFGFLAWLAAIFGVLACLPVIFWHFGVPLFRYFPVSVFFQKLRFFRNLPKLPKLPKNVVTVRILPGPKPLVLTGRGPSCPRPRGPRPSCPRAQLTVGSRACPLGWRSMACLHLLVIDHSDVSSCTAIIYDVSRQRYWDTNGEPCTLLIYCAFWIFIHLAN